jgi:hypothetical protein
MLITHLTPKGIGGELFISENAAKTPARRRCGPRSSSRIGPVAYVPVFDIPPGWSDLDGPLVEERVGAATELAASSSRISSVSSASERLGHLSRMTWMCAARATSAACTS